MSFRVVNSAVKQVVPAKVPPSFATLVSKSAIIVPIAPPPPPPPPALMLFKLMPNFSHSISYVVTPS